jgi:predicted nucleic acid-binding protein
MPRIVVDASVTIAWLFDEDAGTAKLKRPLERSELVAPWLWRLEIANAVLVRERRKVLTEAQALRILQLVDELPIELIAEPALRTVSGLAQTARPHQLSSYDAVYLDLAIRFGLPLFTRDKNLRAAASRAGISLVKEGSAR